MVRSVVFDADDTLLDLRPAVVAGLEAVLADVAREHPEVPLSLDELQDAWTEVFRENPAMAVPLIRTEALGRVLGRAGLSAERERLTELFFEVRFAHTRPYPDALETLARLRVDHLLGYATNGNSLAARCGLTGEFAFELYAHENGLPKKPSVDFYRAIVTATGHQAGEIVYVGDSYLHDVVGPATAGMRTVWVNRSGRDVPGDVEPDAVVAQLSELPEAISGLS